MNKNLEELEKRAERWRTALYIIYAVCILINIPFALQDSIVNIIAIGVIILIAIAGMIINHFISQ